MNGACESLQERVFDALMAAGQRALADEFAEANGEPHTLPNDLREQVRAALVGDSGDAEFSALWAVAEWLGIEVTA